MAEENPSEKHCELCNIYCNIAIIPLIPVPMELKIFIREKITKNDEINKICANCWKGVTSFQNDIHNLTFLNYTYAMKNERNRRDVCDLCCSHVLSNEPVSSYQSTFLSDKYGINLESSDQICNNCKDSLAKHMEQVAWWNSMTGAYKNAPTLEKNCHSSMAGDFRRQVVRSGYGISDFDSSPCPQTETSSAGSHSDSLKSSEHLNTSSPEAETEIIVISSTSNSPTDPTAKSNSPNNLPN